MATASAVFVATVGFKSDFFEIAKQIEIFTTLYKELNMNYVDETNPAQLMDSAVKGMLEELDPYTHFWNEQDVEAAKISNSGEYTGIGAFIKTEKDNITIVEPYKDYPADKAGLKAGDEIVKIGDINISDFSENAAELLQGAPNTKVELTYRRQGKQFTTTLTRGAVEIKAVPFYQLLDNNIGYIVLAKFNRKASQETKEALIDLKSKGATRIILDLRGNPGGLLTEAINVSNLFINKGELVTTTKSVIEKYNKEYHTQHEPVDIQIPLAILVDGKSASASEIVAGSLQDLDRAVIVGGRSFGKGLVQRPKKLPYGTQLKITISRYYTPSGRCIQALDYWHRDDEGNAVRTKSEDYNEFLTKNGRKVYDGGGIMPDVVLPTSQLSTFTSALENEDMIFDFATQYFYSHEVKDVANFSFPENDYKNFMDFLKEKKFDYTSESESLLQKSLENAKDENTDKSVMKSYENLLAEINKNQQQLLIDKKAEITTAITSEIIKRYFYMEGLYNFYIENNPEILKSKEILNDLNQYNKILKL